MTLGQLSPNVPAAKPKRPVRWSKYTACRPLFPNLLVKKPTRQQPPVPDRRHRALFHGRMSQQPIAACFGQPARTSLGTEPNESPNPVGAVLFPAAIAARNPPGLDDPLEEPRHCVSGRQAQGRPDLLNRRTHGQPPTRMNQHQSSRRQGACQATHSLRPHRKKGNFGCIFPRDNPAVLARAFRPLWVHYSAKWSSS